ncbi:MAG: PIG-L family deacetylase, partial [Acidimicrobiales bacterium]
QIEGGKRYDLAEEGRRRANATLLEPRAVEEADEITYAMDLTPLVRNDDLDPTAYITAAIRRFQVDTEAAIARLHG